MASIKWSNLNKYSLVLVEFGNPINDLDLDNEETYRYGLNSTHEFSYLHMAIVVSNEILSNEIAVVPLTSYKIGDEKYPSNIIIDTQQYGYLVKHKTTIKTNHIRSIDKKKRVKKIVKQYISKTLKSIISETLRKSIG